VVTAEIEVALKKIGYTGKENKLLLKVHPAVALHLMEEEYSLLQELENKIGISIQLRDDPLMRLDDFAIFSLPSRKQIDIYL